MGTTFAIGLGLYIFFAIVENRKIAYSVNRHLKAAQAAAIAVAPKNETNYPAIPRNFGDQGNYNLDNRMSDFSSAQP